MVIRRDLIRQAATDPHKDQNDCLYAFCAVVVFGNFEGGDLVLSEIGVKSFWYRNGKFKINLSLRVLLKILVYKKKQTVI